MGSNSAVGSGWLLRAHGNIEKVAGVDDLYTARAAIRPLLQQAVAGCLEVAHGKLTGVDELPLYCTGHQPAAGSGRSRGNNAGNIFENCWRGQPLPLHCMGRFPKAGCGRLQGDGAWEGQVNSARATIRQPAVAGCRLVLTSQDDLYTGQAAAWQPAEAGCWGVAHGKHAGVDYLIFTLHWPPSGSLLWPTAGGAAQSTLFSVNELYTARGVSRLSWG